MTSWTAREANFPTTLSAMPNANDSAMLPTTPNNKEMQETAGLEKNKLCMREVVTLSRLFAGGFPSS